MLCIFYHNKNKIKTKPKQTSLRTNSTKDQHVEELWIMSK